MMLIDKAVQKINNGQADDSIIRVYGLGERVVHTQRSRMLKVIEGFSSNFQAQSAAVFSAPGRTELGGNHTDHQMGNVLAGSVDLDVMACAAPNGTKTIRVISEGYPKDEVDLNDLTPQQNEINRTASLIRGVAAAATKRGYEIGGFDCYMTSNVLGGSGLSSSAAYEIAIGTIINHFFCQGELSDVELAVIGQYAENVYFGKPCGLLDQMAASVGGVITVDFKDPKAPVVTKVSRSIRESGHALCIIDTGSDHKELTGAYQAIPDEMKSIAEKFGKSVLREVDEDAFMEAIPELRKSCGDRAVLRAMHFFAENRRAVEEYKALEDGDFEHFLQLVNESGRSSALYLQNVYAGISPLQQEVLVSLALAENLLKGKGAVRVHGGGFAGTIQAFVPSEEVAAFKAGMEKVLGEGKCHVLSIRPVGGAVLLS